MPILRLPIEQLFQENLSKVKNQTLSSGPMGNIETVEIMQRVARDRSSHPTVRALALQILNSYGTQSHNYIDESKAIGEYVQSRVQYVKDADGVEQLHDPLTMIDQIMRGVARGDCDDMALLIATLLLSIGHTPKFAIVKYQRGYNVPYSHIYVVDYASNGRGQKERVVLDAIIKDRAIGYEVKSQEKNEISI